MNLEAIFGIQFLASLIVWGLLAYWLLVPRLNETSANEAIFYLLIIHAFRHVGMVFLVPGVVANPLPGGFAGPAAYGDLLAGFLAILALIALRNKWSFARGIVWVFSIVGILDLMNALRQPEPIPDMGAAWYIPTMLVPLLIVTHILIVIRLLRNEKNQDDFLTSQANQKI